MVARVCLAYSTNVLALVGHTNQRQALSTLVREERLPSSLLFAGTEGVGKHAVARELARQLLCQSSPAAPQGGCGECKPCKLFDSGNHPDIHTLTFGTDGASVDDIRQVLERLSLRAFMGTRKVAIFDNADSISMVGANCILKTLEEPRPENFFILIASNPSKLPSTILSRCQRWFFDRLSEDEVRSVLHARGASEEEMALAALADGSIGALSTLRARTENADEITAVLDAAWRGDLARITRAAQEWGAEKTTLAERLNFLRMQIRQRLVTNARDPGAAAVWAHALQNTIDAEYVIIDRHVNPTLILLQILQGCSQEYATAYRMTPNRYPTILEDLAR
ncbi:MAG: hypothetical protein RL326_373 [Pseudomonadota bacterium]|jgi:DNA polymerase III delta' subunit